MTAPARFRTLRRSLCPAWLTKGEGGLVGYSLDLMKDAFVMRLFLGLLARFPEAAPEDALAILHRQRRVVRGLNEPRERAEQRLLRWLDDRQTTGNPFALMQQLAGYTGPLPSFRTVDARGNWFSRAADGTESFLLQQGNWDWDAADTAQREDEDPRLRWSRFWVIIYPNGLWTTGDQIWGDPDTQAWGDLGHTWGSSATADQVSTVRFIVSDWKPEGTRCVNIILAFDPASFDPAAAVDDAGMPNGLWEHWSRNVGGVQVPARLSTARYWDGV